MKTNLFLKLLLVASIISQFNVSAQNVDSLELRLQSVDQDTNKVQLYNELVQYYLNVDINKASNYADSMEHLATKLSDIKGLGLVYANKSTLALVRGNYDAALEYIISEKEINTKMKYPYAKSQFHKGIAKVYYYTQNLDSARLHFQYAAKEYKAQNNYNGLSEMMISEGVISYYQGLYDIALDCYLEAQKVVEIHTQDTTTLIRLFNNIGLIFSFHQDADKAIRYYEQGLEMAQIKESKLNEDMLFFNLGDAYIVKENYEKAIEVYTHSLAIKKEFGMPFGTNLARLGYCAFIGDMDYDKAEAYYFQAIEELTKVNNTIAIIDTYEFMTELYLETNQYSKALQINLNTIELAKDNTGEAQLLRLYKSVLDLSFKTQKHELAQEYSILYIDLQDTILSKRVNEKIYELEAEFRDERKSLQLLNLQNENDLVNTNNYLLLLIGGTLLLCFSLVTTFIVYRNSSLKKNKIIADLELIHKNREVQHSRLMESIKKEQYSKLIDDLEETKINEISSLVSTAKTNIRISDNWVDYLGSFKQMNPIFFTSLTKSKIKLTKNDIRLCALILQELKITDISHILKVQTRTVETARYRLRKKLNLANGDDLHSYLVGLNSEDD